MNKIKFDKARGQVIIDGKRIKGQELDYFTQQNAFDKNISTFFNYGGLTYILENPQGDQDEEIHFDINLQYQDAPEKFRLMAMKSEQELDEIIEILEDYGYAD